MKPRRMLRGWHVVAAAVLLPAAPLRAAELESPGGHRGPFQHADEGGGALSAAGGSVVPYCAVGGSVYHTDPADMSSSVNYDLYAGWLASDPPPPIRTIWGWADGFDGSIVVASGVWQNDNSSVYLKWADPNSITDDTFFYTTDGVEPTIASSSTTGNTLLLGPFNPGTTTIKIRARSHLSGAAGDRVWGATSTFLFRYNATVPEPPTAAPTIAEGTWASTPSVTINWVAPTPPPNGTITDYRIVAGTSPGAGNIFDDWIGSTNTTYTLNTSNSNIAPGDTVYVIIYTRSNTGYVSTTSSPVSVPVAIAPTPGSEAGELSAAGGSVVPFHTVDEGGGAAQAGAGQSKAPYSEVGGGVYLTDAAGRRIGVGATWAYTGFLYTDPPPDARAISGWTDGSKTTAVISGTYQSTSASVYLEWVDPNSIADDTFFITTDGSVPNKDSGPPTNPAPVTTNSVTLGPFASGVTTIRVRPRSNIGGVPPVAPELDVIWGPTLTFQFGYSDPVSAQPNAPTNVSVTETLGADPVLTVAWDAAGSPSGAAITDYRVQVGTTPGGSDLFNGLVGSTSTSFTVNGAPGGNAPLMNNGQTVYVTVFAVDELGQQSVTGGAAPLGEYLGTSDPFAPTSLFVNDVETGAQSVTAGGAPPTVTGDFITDDVVAVVFSAIYNDDRGVAEKFQIQVDNDADFLSPVWNSGDAGTALPTGARPLPGARCADIAYGSGVAPTSALLSGLAYFWRIRFWDDTAAGAWSAGTDQFQVVQSGGGGGGSVNVVRAANGGWGENATAEYAFGVKFQTAAASHTFKIVHNGGIVTVSLWVRRSDNAANPSPSIATLRLVESGNPGSPVNLTATGASQTFDAGVTNRVWVEYSAQLNGTDPRGVISLEVATSDAALEIFVDKIDATEAP